MSFILDALKKIERDKRRAAAGEPIETVAFSSARLGDRRPWLSMAAVAVVSAALTAAAVSLFDRGGQSPRPASDDASTAHAAMELENSGSGSAAGGAGGRREGTSSETARLPAASAEPDGDRRIPPGSEPSGDPVVETEDVEAAPPTPDVVAAEPAESLETSHQDEPSAESVESVPPESSSVETVQPFHLVGRERALLDALNVGQDSEPPGGEANEETMPPPAGLPELALQGTSVIDGSPVAVINGQRVFEGDVIEGARVVRIDERAVELELDGQHFTLKL